MYLDPRGRRRRRRASSCWARARSCARCSPAPTCCARTSASPPTSGASTRFTELRRDGLEAERWNRLHPDARTPRQPYVERALGGRGGPGRRGDRLHARAAPTDPPVGAGAATRAGHRRLRPQRLPRGAAPLLRGRPPPRRGRRAARAGRRGRRSSADGRQADRASYGIDPETARPPWRTADARSRSPTSGTSSDVPVDRGPRRRRATTVARRGPAGHARVRQGDDGGARAVRRARSPRCCGQGRRHASSQGTTVARARAPPATVDGAGAEAAAPAEAERRRGARRGAEPRAGGGAEAAEAAAAPRAAARGAEPPARRRRAGLRQPVVRRLARELGVDLPPCAAPGARAGSPRRTSSAPRRRPRRGAGRGAGGAAAGGLDLPPWPRSTSRSTARSSASPLSRIQQASPRPNLRPQLGDDPARHPERRGGHHRARGVPQAAQRRAVRTSR